MRSEPTDRDHRGIACKKEARCGGKMRQVAETRKAVRTQDSIGAPSIVNDISLRTHRAAPIWLVSAFTPFVLLRRNGSTPWAHAALFPLGAIVGITAYAMSVHAVGGWIERSAVLFFNSLFLYSLIRAYGYWGHGELVPERRWLTRAVGILLGIATTRPVMGVFFATSSRTHLSPAQFFGIAFWIGFSINTIIVELWLQCGRRESFIKRHHQEPSAANVAVSQRASATTSTLAALE
jgi:hypothetical protein